MRIAVCLSGQMRTYRRTAEAFVKNVSGPLNADVFVDTWATTGNTTKLTFFLPKGFDLGLPQEFWHDHADLMRSEQSTFERCLPHLFQAAQSIHCPEERLSVSELQELYKTSAVSVEEFDQQYFDELLNIGSIKHLIRETMIFNAAPMYYKIWKCDMMRREAEQKGKFLYDAVIRMRPDFMFLQPFDARHLNVEGKLLTLNNPFYEIVGRADFSNDTFWIGSSEAMTYAADLWKKLPEYWSPDNFPGLPFWERGAEKMLNVHLAQRNLHNDILHIDPAPKRMVLQLSFHECVAALALDIATQPDIPEFLEVTVPVIFSIYAVDSYVKGNKAEALDLLSRPPILGGRTFAEPYIGRARLAMLTGDTAAAEMNWRKAKSLGQEIAYPDMKFPDI